MRVHVPDAKTTISMASTVAASTPRFDGIVGDSPALRRALEAATTAISRRMPAHIVGEQGTGKRLLATGIAARCADAVELVSFPNPKPAAQMLDAIDGALERGAAVVLHRIDRATGEVRDDIANLLRLLDQPQIVLTAGAVTDEVAPVLSALRGIEISLPALRARRDDIPALVRHFLDEAGHPDVRIAAKLRDALVRADWPGNVAQLRTLTESALENLAGPELRLADLSEVHARTLQISRLGRLEEAELTQIREALAEAGGNRVKAAALLGIGRSTLYRKIDSYAAKGFEIEFD